MFFNILAISISLSIDALGIGISYRLKGVKISLSAKLVVGLISVIIMWLSLQAGELALLILPTEVTKIVGVSILLIIGVAFIRNSLYESQETTYDFDKSKKIDLIEAIILGVALSADSMSAGIAASIAGFNYILIPCMVGLMQIFFLYLGEIMADKSLIKKISRKTCGILSGSLLIFIAILRSFA